MLRSYKWAFQADAISFPWAWAEVRQANLARNQSQKSVFEFTLMIDYSLCMHPSCLGAVTSLCHCDYSARLL